MVSARLLRREVAGVHLLLHVGVVFRELDELPLSQQIGPAIAHLSDQEVRLVQPQRRHGGAHAALVVLGEGAVEDGAIGGPDRCAHPLGHLVVAESAQRPELARDVAHRHLARHFARRVPAHPVRDDEDPAVGDHEVVILVPGADHPDIATAGAGYVHADRYATSQWMRSPATPAPPNSNITAPAPHPLPFFSGGGAVCGRLPPGFPPGRAGAAAGAAFAAGGGLDVAGLPAGGTEWGVLSWSRWPFRVPLFTRKFASEPACDGRGAGSNPCIVSLSRSLAPGGAWGAACAPPAGPPPGPGGGPAGAGGAGATSA